MKLAWRDIPEEVRSRLETELVKSDIRKFKSSLLALLLRGCRLLGYQWNTQKSTQDMILSTFCSAFHHVEETSSNDLDSCIHYFSACGLKWKELPLEVKKTIFKGIEGHSNDYGSHDLAELFLRYRIPLFPLSE
jgi:hypothetical protein